MALTAGVHTNGQRIVMANNLAIPAAGTSIIPSPLNPLNLRLAGMQYVVAEAEFTYGSGGTSVDAYIQTTMDGGSTWVDVINFHFLLATASKISSVSAEIAPAAQAFAPTDGSLTANTVQQGVLGDALRCKLVVVGTYAASTLTLDVFAKG